MILVPSFRTSQLVMRSLSTRIKLSPVKRTLIAQRNPGVTRGGEFFLLPKNLENVATFSKFCAHLACSDKTLPRAVCERYRYWFLALLAGADFPAFDSALVQGFVYEVRGVKRLACLHFCHQEGDYRLIGIGVLKNGALPLVADPQFYNVEQ